jgi:hypothetical protein
MKTNNIKLSKPLLVMVLAAGAISARAEWVIVGPDHITVTPGETGSSIYQFTPPNAPPDTAIITSEDSSFQAEGSGVNMPISSTAPITQYLPDISPVGDTITAGTTFDITVDWTISSNPAFIGTEYAANYSIDTDAYGGAGAAQDITFSVVATPEPAQTLAGGMLLGCGIIGFAGRRLLKKKTATV